MHRQNSPFLILFCLLYFLLIRSKKVAGTGELAFLFLVYSTQLSARRHRWSVPFTVHYFVSSKLPFYHSTFYPSFHFKWPETDVVLATWWPLFADHCHLYLHLLPFHSLPGHNLFGTHASFHWMQHGQVLLQEKVHCFIVASRQHTFTIFRQAHTHSLNYFTFYFFVKLFICLTAFGRILQTYSHLVICLARLLSTALFKRQHPHTLHRFSLALQSIISYLFIIIFSFFLLFVCSPF